MSNRPTFTNARGHNQPVKHATPTEIARRDEIIARLHQRGHSSREIADAVGLSKTMVRRELSKMGISSHGVTGDRLGPVMEPCPWRDDEVITTTQPTARWRTSRVVSFAQMLSDEYAESSFANVLANQVAEAIAAGDERWQAEALATFASASEKLERARLIMTDSVYRKICIETKEGDENLRRLATTSSPPNLRAIR